MDLVEPSPEQVITDLVQKYHSYTECFTELKKWVASCLREAIDTDELIKKEAFGYKQTKINFVDDYMFFAMSREVGGSLENECSYIEVAVWVSSYLNDLYGSTVLESLVKHLFFSDTDLEELSYAIALDIDKWCESVDLVVS